MKFLHLTWLLELEPEFSNSQLKCIDIPDDIPTVFFSSEQYVPKAPIAYWNQPL